MAAQLPPKVPNMTQTSWAAADTNTQRMPSILMDSSLQANSQHPSSWVDEFLDFSSSKRGSHRRSVSDSITFLDQITPTVLIGEQQDDHHPCNNNNNRRCSAPGSSRSTNAEFDRFDEEQFMAMFTDDIDISVGPTVCCSNPSSPSDHNSVDDIDHHNNNNNNKRNAAAVFSCDQQMQQLRIESEEAEESASDGQDNTTAGLASADNYNDKIFDPKRIKRILANRQSAQRSRVRKLQYISELERSVNSLQAEVSVLSPRVAFLDHQRLVLNVDNSVLKQRLAALAQDKVFKDAHQEALKREIERLRQVYTYQQKSTKMDNGNPSAPKSHFQQSTDKISDHHHANTSAHNEQIMIS